MNAVNATAYWLDHAELVCGKPETYFSFLEEKGHVVSLVGGGGKTTTMFYLAGCFSLRGIKTAVMTTTRIYCPERYCRTLEECEAGWRGGEYAVCGEKTEEGKFRAPEPAFLSNLLKMAEAVVVEADGSRRRPCKAPAAHEPVILPETDIVIAVMGMDALGRPVHEVCHRPEIVRTLLGCGEDHRLTEEDMVSILLSEQGSKKGVEDRAFYVVLNKCDNEQRLLRGRRILELLKSQGQEKALLTCGMHSASFD